MLNLGKLQKKLLKFYNFKGRAHCKRIHKSQIALIKNWRERMSSSIVQKVI